MINTIKFIGYLFYRYYAKPPQRGNPYFRTIVLMTLLVYIHLMQLLILFNKADLIPIKTSDNKLTKSIIMLIVLIPIYLFVTKLFKKSDIERLKEKYDYNWDKVHSGNIWLIIYIILSMGSNVYSSNMEERVMLVSLILLLAQATSSSFQNPVYVKRNRFHTQITIACENHDLVLAVPILPVASSLITHL